MSAYISAALRRRVRHRFSDRCAYCQTPEALTVATFELEHIVPRSAGGMTVLANLCLACPNCNRYKAHHQTAVDPVTAQPVPLFHPCRQEWQEHFAWSPDGSEIIGLTPVGRATVTALKMNRPPLVRLRQLWIKLQDPLFKPL